MSSSGVRKQKTFQDRTIDILKDSEQDFIQDLKVTGTESSFGGQSTQGETSGGSPQDPPGNFLEVGGGTMQGPIAYNPQDVEINSDDEINIGFEQGAYSTYIKMTAVASTDDLVNIVGAQHDGQDLILQGTTGKTITLKTTGNITPPGGVDFDLIDDAMLRMIFDPTTDKWVSNFTGGVGGITNQIIDGNTSATVLDSAPSFVVILNGIQKYSISNTRADYEDLEVFGFEKIWMNDHAGTGSSVTIGHTTTQFFDINVISTSDILRVTFAGDESARFTDGRFQLFSSAPNIQSASMSMFRDDPSPGSGDALADIDFDGNDSASNFTTYASIVAGIETATSGLEEGRLSVQLTDGGSLVQAMRLNLDSMELDDKPIRLDGIATPSTLLIAPTQGLIYAKDLGGGVTAPFWLDDNGLETNLASASNQIIDGNTSATVLDSAPSFVVLLNGIQKYSISNTRADYEDLEVFGIEMLHLNAHDGLSESVQIGHTTTQFFDINVNSTSDIFRVTFAGDEMARFTDGRFQLFSSVPNTQSASMSFFRDDPSPGAANALADIDFDGNDSASNFTTYASILGGIEVATSGAERGRVTIQCTQNGTLQNRFRVAIDQVEVINAPLRFDEISTPSNPPANQGLLYVKDDASTTTLYFRDSAGAETDLLAGGASGADTDLNNLVTTSINQNLTPNIDLNQSLGTTLKAWSNGYIRTIVLDIAGKTIASSGASDVHFDVPSGGDMKFREAGTEFWRLDGGANVSIFSRDIELDGTNRAIRAFDGTEIGFFVKNGGETVGTAGSIQMPVVASLTPTVSSLNSAFGSAIGCFGMYNTSASIVNMAIKNLSGEWVLLAFPDAGGNVLSDHIT